VQRALAGDPVHEDHVTSTQSAADRQAGRPVAATRTDWRGAADRTLAMVHEADVDSEVTVWGIPLPLGAVLVARAFELWTHENDVREAAGLPASVPDAATLRLMTELATGMLPFGAIMTGLQGPIDLRLVLTGPGGGTWDVAIGGDAPEPASIAIVTDVVGFCRLAANRASPADLDVHVTGDLGRASGCWPPPRRWHSTDPPPLPATSSPGSRTQRELPPLCLGARGRVACVAGGGPAVRRVGWPPVPSEEAQHQRRQRDPGDRHRDQQQAPAAVPPTSGRAGQTANPPDDDADRMTTGSPIAGWYLRMAAPIAAKAMAVRVQASAVRCRPGRIGLLEVRGRRLPGWRLPGWRVPCLRVQGVLTADSRASAAASRPMAAMAIARM
jgi:uncharacterized protein (TIGR03083 family)